MRSLAWSSSAVQMSKQAENVQFVSFERHSVTLLLEQHDSNMAPDSLVKRILNLNVKPSIYQSAFQPLSIIMSWSVVMERMSSPPKQPEWVFSGRTRGSASELDRPGRTWFWRSWPCGSPRTCWRHYISKSGIEMHWNWGGAGKCCWREGCLEYTAYPAATVTWSKISGKITDGWFHGCIDGWIELFALQTTSFIFQQPVSVHAVEASRQTAGCCAAHNNWWLAIVPTKGPIPRLPQEH